MKKPLSKLLLSYLLGLSVMGLIAWPVSLFAGHIPLDGFPKLIPAFVLMIVAVVFHKKSKGHALGYLCSYFLNAIASGATIGVVLAECNIAPSLNLALALLPAAGLGILVSVLLLIFKKTDGICAAFTVLALLMIIISIAIWVGRSALVGSILLFSGLFFLPLPFCLQNAVENPEREFRYLSFSGFGAFAIIAFVAMVILSEGEILEGVLEGLDFGGGKGKKK